MNFALEVLAARQRRDATIQRVRDEAKRQIAEARATRDREIRRLAADTSATMDAIASAVGCSSSHVHEVLRPEKQAIYNARRREQWKVYSGGRAA